MIIFITNVIDGALINFYLDIGYFPFKVMNFVFVGRTWLCLSLNEGQLESYLHVLSSHQSMLGKHYASGALLRDPHRANIMLMMAAGLEHIKLNISMVCWNEVSSY